MKKVSCLVKDSFLAILFLSNTVHKKFGMPFLGTGLLGANGFPTAKQSHYLGQVCGIMGEMRQFWSRKGEWVWREFFWGGSLSKGTACYIFLFGKQKGSRSFLSSFCLFTFQRNVKAFCGARRLLVSRLIRKINQ